MTPGSRPNHNPWSIAPDAFRALVCPVEQWRFFVQHAILAPSNHNSQPWQFHIKGKQLEIYADRARACRVSDPEDRELIMSCGCALFYLRIAMRHFAALGTVEILPDSSNDDLIARVALGHEEEVSIEDAMLYYAITRRRTNRQPFRAESLPVSLMSRLQAAAEGEGAGLVFAIDPSAKHQIAELIAKGDRIQWSDKNFRRELACWVHSNHSSRGDGIPGYAQGADDLMSCAGPLVVRRFDMGRGQAAKDREVATGSPALAVLSTRYDSARAWLAAGQALARVLLRARMEDVWASFLNQALEVSSLRPKVLTVLHRTGFPQAILRLGFGNDIKPTPRREIEEVLI